MRLTTRTDLFLAALLSALLHYAVVTVIPARDLRGPVGERLAAVELDLVAPRTEEERRAPMPEISLPTTSAEPEAEAAPEPQPLPEPDARTAAPEPEAPSDRATRDLPDTFLQSVDLENPNEEERPDDPHFLAQSNMDVEEETVARTRSRTRSDAEPVPSGEESEASTDDEQGDGEEEVSGEDEDREGERALESAVASVQSLDRRAAAEESGLVEARPEVEPVEAVTRSGYEGESTGDLAVESEPGREGAEGSEGRQGRPGRRGKAIDLRITWGQFQNLYGEGELRREREEIAERRRAKSRGRHGKNWERVRAAIENYVPQVRPGNQTALRTAQAPFAQYLATVHRRIHRFWGDGFLVDLLALGDGHPMNDFTLRTDLEIVIDDGGDVADVGVVRTSGVLAFDAAAVDSVYRSGPHPNPPREIVSGDGRVYLHWGFYRNARQCGTFNATPFLLPNPPSMPRDTGEPPEEPGTPDGSREEGPSDGAPAPRRPAPTAPPGVLGVPRGAAAG